MARLNNEPRSNESPMDYEWEKGRGPVGDSPFVSGTGNQVLPNGFAGGIKSMYSDQVPISILLELSSNIGKRLGSSSELDSPTKSSHPQLREPNGQAWLFNSLPTKNHAVNAYREPSNFTTPRRPIIEADETSGPDQSSPAYADSEATPDPPARSSPVKKAGALVRFGGSNPDQKPKPSANLSRSGKGEIPKRAGYSDILHRKVEKRRRRTTDRDVQDAPRRYSNDSDSEERPSSSEDPNRPSGRNDRMGFIPSVLTFIDAHPSLPNTLSTYIQFFLNCVFASILLYILYGILSTIRSDIDERAMIESSEILTEMAICAREFKENRCERGTRVPAMENVCNSWEKCMARDPYKVGRSRLSAGMFAEIFNSFIEPISMKAIAVSMAAIVGCFCINNLAFSTYRARHAYHAETPGRHPAQPSRHQQQAFLASPPQPSQHQQGQQLGYETPGYGQFPSQWYGQTGGMQHQPYGGFGLEGEGSPTKRLGYR